MPNILILALVMQYILTVSGYTGNAGDSMTHHNGAKFSAKDRDNDAYTLSCSVSPERLPILTEIYRNKTKT